MRRAFTLLELMVVVGIMAFLGIASANSYNALRHGIEERSAVDAASAVLRAAKERALVDRVPTAVFCWNRCVREADMGDGGRDAIVVGEAVAVRRVGRITCVDGGKRYLYDEFGDLDHSYNSSDNYNMLKGNKGFRLWYMSDNGSAGMKYSTVSSGVLAGVRDGLSYLPLTVSTPYDARTAQILFGQGHTPGEPAQTVIPAYAFCNLGQSDHEPDWKVGSAYGMEFQRLRLPDNFTFGRDDPPTDFGTIKEAKTIMFYPEGSAVDHDVVISFCRADGQGVAKVFRTIGAASSKEKLAEGQ